MKTVAESLSLVEFIYCFCGCQKTRPKYDRYGYERKFIKGHTQKGKKRSAETKQKLSDVRKGENNPMFGITGKSHPCWKGDKVGYSGLHLWIRKYFPKPQKCQMCKEKIPEDVANITGIYNREFKNWAWFCTKCHYIFDNLLERNLKQYRNK
jgi:NUMOD3 motif-containing protein